MAVNQKNMLGNLVIGEMKRNVARVYAKVGRIEEAKRIWQEQIRNRPDSFEAHLELGKIYARHGDRNSALEEYRRLRQIITRHQLTEPWPSVDAPRDDDVLCTARMEQQQSVDETNQAAQLRELIQI